MHPHSMHNLHCILLGAASLPWVSRMVPHVLLRNTDCYRYDSVLPKSISFRTSRLTSRQILLINEVFVYWPLVPGGLGM